MFRLTIENKTYEVRFLHKKSQGSIFTHLTDCEIALIDDERKEHIGCGRAFCKPKDQFSKARGRKLALARALVDAQCDKPLRALLWQEYFKRGPVTVKRRHRDRRTIALLLAENAELWAHYEALVKALEVMGKPVSHAARENLTWDNLTVRTRKVAVNAHHAD